MRGRPASSLGPRALTGLDEENADSGGAACTFMSVRPLPPETRSRRACRSKPERGESIPELPGIPLRPIPPKRRLDCSSVSLSEPFREDRRDPFRLERVETPVPAAPLAAWSTCAEPGACRSGGTWGRAGEPFGPLGGFE